MKNKDNFIPRMKRSLLTGTTESSYTDYTLGTTYDYSDYDMLFSMRRLTTNTEYCLKVVRDDNIMLDIGFKDGMIDKDTLSDFCSDGQALYVTDWYDQSGNGHTLSRTTSPGPRIAYNGVVDTSDGKVCMYFWIMNSYGGDPQCLEVSNYTAPDRSYQVTGNFVLGAQEIDVLEPSIIGTLFEIEFSTSGYKMIGEDDKMKSDITLMDANPVYKAEFDSDDQQIVQNVLYYIDDDYYYTTRNDMYIGGSYKGRELLNNVHSAFTSGEESGTVRLGSTDDYVVGKVQEITFAYKSDLKNLSTIATDIKNYL